MMAGKRKSSAVQDPSLPAPRRLRSFLDNDLVAADASNAPDGIDDSVSGSNGDGNDDDDDVDGHVDGDEDEGADEVEDEDAPDQISNRDVDIIADDDDAAEINASVDGAVVDNGGDEQDAFEDVGPSISQEPPLLRSSMPPPPRPFRQSSLFSGVSGSAFSGVTGATGRTSFSQEQIDDMDSDVMLDVLPNLATAADALIKFLLPPDANARPFLWKDIRDQGTKYHKLFENRVKSMDVHKSSFGTQEYIEPSFVVRALLNVGSLTELPPASWRPDSIIYKINVAQMLRNLLSEAGELSASGAHRALSQLDLSFANAIAGRGYKRSTLLTVLGIGIQLCIASMKLYEGQSEEVLHVIQSTFQLPDRDLDNDGLSAYKHTEALGLNLLSDDAQRNCFKVISRTIESLSKPFTGEGPVLASDGLAELERTYPWRKFIQQTVSYCELRAEELGNRVQAEGGLSNVVDALAGEVRRRDAARLAKMKRQSLGSSIGAATSLDFRASGVMASMKERQRMAKNVTTSTSQALVVPMVDSRAPTPLTAADEGLPMSPDVDDAAQLPSPSAATRTAANATSALLSRFQAAQKQNSTKGKGRFIDSQPLAQKVQWDESNIDSTQSHPRDDARRIGRRAHWVDIDDEGASSSWDVTQDEGFQMDERGDASANRRRAAPATTAAAIAASTSTRVTQHFNFPSQGESLPELLRRASSEQSSSGQQHLTSRPAKNPGSRIPQDMSIPPATDEALDSVTQYQHARNAAVISAATRLERPMARSREKWSEVEEQALIELIAQGKPGNIRYSLMKTIDDQAEDGRKLSRRTAEDMRFKARNMKFNYLAGLCELPDNFEYVKLDQKLIENLHERNIPYEQESVRAINRINFDDLED